MLLNPVAEPYKDTARPLPPQTLDDLILSEIRSLHDELADLRHELRAKYTELDHIAAKMRELGIPTNEGLAVAMDDLTARFSRLLAHQSEVARWLYQALYDEVPHEMR